MSAKVIRVTPTLTTTAYSANDIMGTEKFFKLSDVFRNSSEAARLESVAVLDKVKQKAAFDILFFNAEPVVASADNAAMDITDAEMAAKYIGRVSIAGTDYADLANNSDATKRSINFNFARYR
jgi:hypothetical protein